MPGFGDTAVIALIALLLFGPKKLPVLARQLGKLMAEFRRASNEFRSQMEEELRIAEQADRQKEVAALEAASANMIAPPALGEPAAASATTSPAESFAGSVEESDRVAQPESPTVEEMRLEKAAAQGETYASDEPAAAPVALEAPVALPEPAAPITPIATSGDLNVMPPETGLPIGRGRNASSNPMIEPEQNPAQTRTTAHEAELEPETLHG